VTKISLVVSDVDGTLVTRDKALTPRAIAAVERLHARGIAFSICSSRPPFGLRMLIEPLRLALPFGGYNGGTIVTPDFGIVEQRLIPADAARTAVEMFHAKGIDCWLFVGNEWVILNPEGSHVAHETRTVQTPPTVVPAFTEAHLAGAGKIVGPNDDHDLIARLAAELGQALAGRANVARSQPYYCDVVPPRVDKGRLIVLLSERLGVPRQEILVLGDMENDLEMFAAAGFSVAMGNAAAAVKRTADAVTLSNDEDGFAVAIERHVLGD
jgi:Cof subfamily protein (haloacid dehalogenase superfamily)